VFREQRPATGTTYSQIALKLKVSKSTLSNWNADLEGEIASARAIELDALYEEYFMTKERRINLLGTQLKRINDELLQRDINDIPTDKLFALQMNYAKALKEEFTETRPKSEIEIRFDSMMRI
jgi:hypothetical protein